MIEHQQIGDQCVADNVFLFTVLVMVVGKQCSGSVARTLSVPAKFLVFAGFDDVQDGTEQLLGFFRLGPTGIVPVVLQQDLVGG